MNNYSNPANIKSPCPNYIDIESLNGCTMPERRSSDDHRISWHPTATGRSSGSHRWTTGRSPSGHRPKFRSSAKWIGRPPSSRLAVAGRRLVLHFYDPVQGRKNPAMICRCLKTGISGKSGDHCTILKACDAAFSWGIKVLMLMETKHHWFALGVISSGTWCPVPLYCDRAFSLCEEFHQLLSVNCTALLQYVVSVRALDNECCIITVAVDYRVLTETLANTYFMYNPKSHFEVITEWCLWSNCTPICALTTYKRLLCVI